MSGFDPKQTLALGVACPRELHRHVPLSSFEASTPIDREIAPTSPACVKLARIIATVATWAKTKRGPRWDTLRSGSVPHDADYYRARAIEERGRAEDADRADVAAIHRELAQQFDGLAEQFDALAEQFDVLAERASHLIRERER